MPRRFRIVFQWTTRDVDYTRTVEPHTSDRLYYYLATNEASFRIYNGHAGFHELWNVHCSMPDAHMLAQTSTDGGRSWRSIPYRIYWSHYELVFVHGHRPREGRRGRRRVTARPGDLGEPENLRCVVM